MKFTEKEQYHSSKLMAERTRFELLSLKKVLFLRTIISGNMKINIIYCSSLLIGNPITTLSELIYEP